MDPFRYTNNWPMVLAMLRSDPLFKLRLPRSLRAQLEEAAMGSGRSLTAEILSRLEASFPTAPDRLAALEAMVRDPECGLARLLDRITEMEGRLASLEKTKPST